MSSRPLPTSLYVLLLCVLIAANVNIYKIIFAPRVLEVTVLEVGKGTAALVCTPKGRSILIDAGPDASILRALGEALPMWQRSIDAIILTGTKSSFVGGLAEVVSRYHVSTIMHFGDKVAPYGTSLTFDDSHIKIISPDILSISYGSTSLTVSSTTPKGVYISDGKTITYAK
ncbi:MAG: ComEC/Rec2 family competence protein [Minisyncoccota bacterium]